MNYELDLNDRPFKAIKAGTKTIESRVPTSRDKFDYKDLKSGDKITFVNNSTGEKITVEVIGIRHYKDFRTLLKTEGTEKTLSSGKSIEEAVESFNDFSEYKQNIPKYGVWAIRVTNYTQEKSNLITKQTVSTIVSFYFDSKYFDFKKINQGLENRNIILEVKKKKYIIRIYNIYQFGQYKRDDENLLYELEFVEYLGKNGVPVPEIIKNKAGKSFIKIKIGRDSYYVAIFKFIEGDMFKELNKEIITEVAKWQARIHNLSVKFTSNRKRPSNGPIDYYKWWSDFIGSGKKLDNSTGEKLEKIMDRLHERVNPETIGKFDSHLIHSDMHKENLKFESNKLVGILDFDDCREGIFSEDIAMFLHEILKEGKSFEEIKGNVDVYFNTYSKIRFLTSREKSMAIFFAMIKVYQLRYFDLYFRQKSGENINDKIDEANKLIDNFLIFEELAKSY